MKNLLTLCFILLCMFSYAAEVQWTSRLEGDAILGGNLLIEDGDYTDLNAGTFTDARSFGFIRFGLNERLAMDYESSAPNGKQLRLLFEVTMFDNFGQVSGTSNESLDMEYHTGSSIVLDASDYRMKGIHKFSVKITGAEIDGVATTTLRNYVFVEAGFFAERYYQLDLVSTPNIFSQMIHYPVTGGMDPVGTTSTTSETDEIILNWEYVDGAEYYDLEWTWVDNYGDANVSTVRPAGDLSMTEAEFRSNSTRIRTSGQHYKLPQLFAKGYVVFRVRGVGRWLDDTDKDLYGKWSSGVGATDVDDWDYFTVTEEHEQLKNWQYQATYAEEGKKKEVTQYFDGSLRGRQTVTRINSDNHSVVGETVYDNQGRGVIQVLPVPQDNPSIKYYSSLNKNTNGATYSHQDFDWEAAQAPCNVVGAPALSNESGAGEYYSVLGYNALTDQPWQQYVPESEGYAFTQVEYTPDNTGRIRNQSGVGPKHTIGSGQETYYYYLQPSQEELDRLFGYKVGKKSHYKKNMVVDANGQVSVSYLDAQGRVVATAMAGDNDTEFQSLNSESDGTYHDNSYTDLLNKEDQGDEDTGVDDNVKYSTGRFGPVQDGLKMESQLGVVKGGTQYDFSYNAIPGVYTEECDGVTGVSYPYVYDLTLSLRDDCGTDVFSDTFALIEVGEESIGGAVNSFNQTIASNPILNQGSYTLYKNLTVNEEALARYTTDYLSDANSCIIDVNEFLEPFSTDPCPTTCEECVDELGSLSEFKDQWAQDSLGSTATATNLSGSNTYYENIYQETKEECLQGCEPTLSCDAYRVMLMADMSPGGQYASTISGTSGNVSVYVSGQWRTEFSGATDPNYLDEYGNPALIEAYPNGTTVMGVPEYTITANGSTAELVEPWQLIRADFILTFETSWAEALIEFHPEYPLYEYASAICSEQYDLPTSSGVLAMSSEYFDVLVREQLPDYASLSTNPYDINFLTTNPLYDLDPYFQHTYGVHENSQGVDYSQLKNDLMLEALNTDYKGTGMTMLKFAIKTAIEGNDISAGIPTENWSDFGSATFTVEQEKSIWEKYKFYYLSYKLEINQLLMDFYGFDVQTTPSPIYNGCIGSTSALSFNMLGGFSHSNHYSTILTHTADLWDIGSGTASFPTELCGAEFDDKQIRIVRMDALYNPSNTPAITAASGAQDADFSQWQQTGLCPLTVDIERLLNGMAQEDQLVSTTAISQTEILTFVPDLYEAFTGSSVVNSSGLTNVTIQGTASSASLTLSVTNGTSNSEIVVSAPTNSTSLSLDWNDYGTVWRVKSVSASYPVPGAANSQTKILVEVETIATGDIEEFIASYEITGASTTNFNECFALQSSNNDPDCDKEELLEADILQVMQAQLSTGTFATSANITNEAYYVGSTLEGVIGATTTDWILSNSSTFYIGDNNNGITFDFLTSFPTNDFVVTSFEIIVGSSANPVGTAILYLLDDAGQPHTLTGTYSYQQGGEKRLPLDVSCPCDESILSDGSIDGDYVCQPCNPTQSVLEPESCTDAFVAYNGAMAAMYGMPVQFETSYTDILADNTSGYSEEQIAYALEHYIDEVTFCASSYAYITEAYLYFIAELESELAVTVNHTSLNFLSISEFGSTPLGYSNDLLMTAVDAYIASGNYDPLNTVSYIEWNDFVFDYFNSASPVICPVNSPEPYFPAISIEEAPCNQWENNIDIVNAQNQYAIYLDQLEQAFIQAYVEGAIASVKETFTVSHFDKEYHYTLYYYDRAGNLIETVPPKGVQRFEFDPNGGPVPSANGDISVGYDDIADYRSSTPTGTGLGTSSARLAPDHTFETIYRYNSLNQLVYQHTPDGGESTFAYDKLGRLVVSQNAKQLSDDQFSYTVYDFLGRVIEVGEMKTPASTLEINEDGRLIDVGSGAEFDVNSLLWIEQTTFAREEVTRTIYDELGGVTADYNMAQAPTVNISQILVQDLFGTDYAIDNTRNRIVGIIYQEDHNPSMNVYESATFYDYDVHGNVKELIQVHNAEVTQKLNQHIKHTEYEYDLVSGNVNKVIYQKNQEDQFIHRYCYDSDNRITIAETSKDDVVFEKDAKYFYYEHGPLARTEIGEDKVQASDYAYTIQGWMKTVNGEEVDESTMMGQDGKQNTVNGQMGRDAYGFSLSYFDGDYASVNNAMLSHTSGSNAVGASLFNGNIRTMVTALVDTDEEALTSHQTTYGYDQLNRIKSMDGSYREVGQTAQTSGYSSTYAFDQNGNLSELTRFAVDNTGVTKLMDDFKYHYEETPNGGNNNQLSWVEDEAINGLGQHESEFDDADIDGSMGAGNYEYDPIGQLTKDTDEGITKIKWKVTNKVEEVVYADKTIHFDYDAMGNRIAKHVTGDSETTSTFYILDAQGNCMSVYTYTANNDQLQLSERNLYGSSRLGLEQVDQTMAYINVTATSQLSSNFYTEKNLKGDKRFELSNHLGNVLEVITDRKIPEPVDGQALSEVDYYSADVIAYNDYYPYGMIMPNRNGSDNSANYRYGFQGQEQDPEVKEEKGTSISYVARMYDPRIGRFLSLDPKASQYPFMSPYCYAGNSPIRFSDEKGEGPGDRVKKAKEIQQHYKNNSVIYSQTKRKIGMDIGYSDCSAFVTTVLQESGYGSLFKATHTGAQTGGGMQGEIKNMSGSEGLTEPYSMTPKEGDVIMWGGHVGIVTEVTDKKVIFAAMGGSGAAIGSLPLTDGSVDLSQPRTLRAANSWGSGGFWGFWSPEEHGVHGDAEYAVINDNPDIQIIDKKIQAHRNDIQKANSKAKKVEGIALLERASIGSYIEDENGEIQDLLNERNELGQKIIESAREVVKMQIRSITGVQPQTND